MGRTHARVGCRSARRRTSADRTEKVVCTLKLTLVNISGAGRNGGVAIRLDGDPPDCAVSLHTAIKAPFNIVKIGGVTASERAVHGHEGQPLLGTA